VNPLPATRKPFFCYQRAMLLKKARHRAADIPATVQTPPDEASRRMIRALPWRCCGTAAVISYRIPPPRRFHKSLAIKPRM
jgi:hypothetical protein